jgi:FtsZ-binding cell division protein ZapB
MNPIGKKSAPVTPAIAKQPERYPGVAHKTRELPNNFRLNIYSTNGNGSCGIHALVGEPKKGEFRADDKKIRKDFCIWLRAKQIENMLPERIEQTLKDYLIYPEHAPDTFNNSNAVQEAREQLTPLRIEVDELRRERAQYQKSTGDLVTKNPNLDEAENRLAKLETMMIYDFEVVEAYLAVIKDTGQYLLQDELVAIAESLGKRIILFQPGWGEDRNKLQYSEITPEGTQVVSDLDPSQFSENTVCIYYNGLNHYEKAVVVKAE